MRRYSQNSPLAAARIVALATVADGDLNKAELALLDELAVHEKLGLQRETLHAAMDTFYADLLSSKQLAWADTCPVDEYTLKELLAEVDDPALRRTVLDLCVRIAEVDGHVAEGESIVLVTAVEQWGLQRERLKAPAVGDDEL